MFPGVKFSPTDEELISYYLKHKMEGCEKLVEIISEVEICKYEPWDLPAKSVLQSDNEWFFFSPHERKYPRGSQSRRATDMGYWKSTGKERDVKVGSNVIGRKRTLVFYAGRPPKGERTEWIMHEFSMILEAQDFMVVCRLRKNSKFLLNDIPSQRQQLSMPEEFLLNNIPRPVPEQFLSYNIPRPKEFFLTNIPRQQSSVSEGAKADECCSEEFSSSYNSRSVEQIDSGSESIERFIDELF